MTVIVKIKDEASAELQRLAREVPKALEKAILREAMRIFAESQRRVPVDTGALRASGGVGKHQGKITIFYAKAYALLVHEAHRSKAKFLEQPFREALPGLADRVVRDARRIAGMPPS